MTWGAPTHLTCREVLHQVAKDYLLQAKPGRLYDGGITIVETRNLLRLASRTMPTRWCWT